MKDHISKLSDEELKRYCTIITGKAIKSILKNRPQDYKTLAYGKRVEKLKNNECEELVVKKRNNKFIQMLINDNAEYMNRKTSEDIENNTNEEVTADEALAKSIISFGFDKDVELYFILTDRPIDEEYIQKITALIDDEMRQKEETEHRIESEAPAKVQTAPELPDTSEMESKLAEMQQREQTILEQYEAEKAAHESDTERYNEELESLKKQLSASQLKISQLESELNRLLVFDDSEVARSISSDYQHISLCQLAGYNSYNVLYANRFADVNSMGAINSFISDPFQEKKFANRDRLYPQGGPTEIGQFGIWQWSSEPNYADPSKDFLKYNYDPDLIPTEIIYLSECHSLDDVIQQLKTGVKNDPVSEKTIFAVLYDNGVIQGVCCTKSQLEANDGMVKLNEQVTAIPVYQFDEKNCIQIASKVFFNNISLGKPVKIARIKDSFDIIRQIILENINWTSFKQRGVNKAEWRNYRAYIEELHSADIIEKISKECLCSEKEAEELLREFTDRAAQYIVGDSIEDDVLLSVISVNADLMERCKGLITIDWQEENRQKIDEADRDIQDKTGQIESLSAESLKIENNIENLTKTKERIEKEISEKEKLAADVQSNVETIIAKAQEHAAEFMASMAFVNTTGSTPAAVEKSNSSCFTSGKTLQSEQAEEYENWKDLIDTLSDNLVEAGVRNDYSESFAAFMYSAHMNHSPLLLAGPNASEIVDAFSAALVGKTACTLECVGDYDRSIISAALESEDQIIKIKNPFSAEWVSYIIEMGTEPDKFCMPVHPFIEDVVIEPKGMMNYFYPVMTELLVSDIPNGEFLYGHRSEGYQDYQHTSSKGKKVGILKDMRMSMMVYNRINGVMNDLHKMLDDDSIDYDVLYAILPYAYMTMQTEKLLDAVNNKKLAVSKDLADELNRLFGDE